MNEPVDPSVTGAATLRCIRVVLRNPRRMIGLVWLGVVLLVFGTPVLGIGFGSVGAVSAFIAALASFVVASRVEAVRRIGGSVVLDPGALRLTGGNVEKDVSYPLSSIVAGYQPRSERSAVIHLANGAQLVIHLEKDDPALLLAHAGVGVTQRALTLPLRGQLGAFTIGLLAVWPSLFFWFAVANALRHELGGFGILAALVLTVLSTALVVIWLGFPRVVVGTDGVRILGRLIPRFIPHEEIEAVELVPPVYQHGKPSIRIRRKNGWPIALPTIAAPRDRVEGLARRIEEAVRAHAAGGARGLDALARAGRPAAVWKGDIRRMALAPPTFRNQALGIDDYERVLADAAAAPDRRVGAALAVRAIDPQRGPSRIRVAASASADEALRAALEAAAEGEIDEAVLDRAARRARR